LRTLPCPLPQIMRKLAVIVPFVLITIGAYAQNKVNDSLRQALKLAKEDTAKVNLLNSLGFNYFWNSTDSCLMYSRQALKLARTINYPSGIAASENNICFAFSVLGNYPQALDYGIKSIELWKKLNNPDALTEAYNGIAVCYREQGNYKKSLDYVHVALDFAKSAKVSPYWYYVTCDVATTLYARTGQLDSALYFAHRVDAKTLNTSGITYALGSIYFQKNDHRLALQYFRKTIALAGQSNTKIDILDAYNGMARLYFKEDRTDSAIYYSELVLSQKWGKTYPAGVFRAANMLADIYEKRGVTDSTLKYLKLTIALKDSLYSSQKVREAGNIDFNNQLQQQELTQQQNKAQTRLVLISLTGGVFTLLVIGFMQRRGNRQKQKAYLLLQKQKQETDVQKEKAEKTLEELKTTQNQLIQSAKMASLGELTAGIAHEIQNPLNFVNNFSDVSVELVDEMQNELKNGDKDEAIEISEDIKQNLEKIRHHGKRADAIVKGMLQHSQSSSGTKEPTNINELADNYMRLAYQGLLSKDKNFMAELVTHFDDKLPKVNVIPQDIGRVMLNLFNNAFYAAKQKTAGQSYKPEISVTTSTKNGQVFIQVKDNGIGIPDAIKEKIMQPFFTTKPTGEGTGLGLSLSYDIVVKGHGGSIKVDTQEGEFTEFIVGLPLNG